MFAMGQLRQLMFIGLVWIGVGIPGAWAQTGKIAGVVTDAETGEPLPGVNVVIEGTTMGATTDIEGYYVILNVRPGTYRVRASFVGYAPVVAENVDVSIGLTTELNFRLQPQAIGLEEVVVTVQRPVVQPDVSASLANIRAEQVENLPVVSIADVIGLQAGFEPGLTIRGAGGDQVAFAIDGMSLADPRGNTPILGVSFTAIEEVQVQTGGFNAEYGNVRSGLINVVTKEPTTNRYFADVLARYSPPSRPYFGATPGDLESYFVKPFLDTTPLEGCPRGVAYCGTSVWPRWLQEEYPSHQGWDALAGGTPWTPEQLYSAYQWLVRKDFTIREPNYEFDGTIGGPVPLVSRYLGNLRFTASYRQVQTALMFPEQRPAYRDRLFQGKLISDIATGMKLSIDGLYRKQLGHAAHRDGRGTILTGEMPRYPWDSREDLMPVQMNIGFNINMALFGDWGFSPTNITQSMIGAKFTHALSPATFYEVQLQRIESDYFTFMPRPRKGGITGPSAIVKCIRRDGSFADPQNGQCAAGELGVTEAPFGFKESYENAATPTPFGLLGSQAGSARDTSNIVRYAGRVDLTSQVNRVLQIKTGLEYIFSDYHIRHGVYDPANPHHENEKFRWDRTPVQAAYYAQAKLEFKGMIANLGLRFDYFNPSGRWYDYTAFDRALSASIGIRRLDQVLPRKPVEKQLTVSPRLGVSFPITENSKLYFNYGHFRQMLTPQDLFRVEYISNGAIFSIGNPNQPLPRTIAYELGFEQNIADQFLLRLAGFYRDLHYQPREVEYISVDDAVDYFRVEPLNYGDVRGFELTVEKNRGRWIRGFVNYTYLARKFGNFGYGQINENRAEFRQYLTTTTDHYPWAPVPEPFARVNLELIVPEDYGLLLGDWRLNLLGEWRAGAKGTWNGQNFEFGPGNDPEIAFNTGWKDYYNLDLRLSKNLQTSVGRVQFFVDVTNVLNLRRMYWSNGSIFEGPNDLTNYFRSLHLPGDIFGEKDPGYVWVPGKDKPGDYRKPGVAYDPIFAVLDVTQVTDPIPNVLYWDKKTGQYMTYANGSWGPADKRRVDYVLKNKAYISMPSESYLAFLNPRDVYFGVRITF
ncbi:TonB-dependent receptor [Rhodothermus bifroesti]|uniref:TonB-dependent receptor plug domain-containing protein n=1 Tax=Rhodothermus marinus TaxID=29549 RepID=A0A7V2AZ74_RHOMR|nr:TonB-dependent receptor [Rhodothermus bifroesti]GBD01816.1 TonB-dependent receptor SusC [bacterium HR18]